MKRTCLNFVKIQALSRAVRLAASLALPVAAFLSWQPTAAAAAITWATPGNITSDSDVSTTGIAVYAYDWAGANATVNGVSFAGASSVSGAPPNVSLSGSAGAIDNNETVFTSTSSPFSGLSTAYKSILVGGDFAASASSTWTVTLTNLTLGAQYVVQIWVNDPRNSTTTARTETVTSSGGNTVTLDYGQSHVTGSPGQYVIGTFTASATTQTFTLLGAASTQMNAMQVRTILPSQITAVWNGGSLVDSNWSDSANWNGTVITNNSCVNATFSGTTSLNNTNDLSGLTLAEVTLNTAGWNISGNTVTSDGFIDTATGTINWGLPTQLGTPLVGGSSITNQIATGGILDFTGVLSGSGGLTKTGSGNMVLSSTDTYTGPTTISAGTLALTGSGAIAGSTPILIASNAVFDVSALGTFSAANQSIETVGGGGSVNGNVIAASTVTIAPGGTGAPGTLTFSNNLTLNSSAISLLLSTNPSGPSNDLINVVGVVTNNGNSVISLAPSSASSLTLSAGTYTLLSCSSLVGSGTFALSFNPTNTTLNVGSTAITLVVGTGGSVTALPTNNAVWSGGSAFGNNWNDPGNWVGTALPSQTTPDTLIFAGTSRQTNTNNLSSLTLAGLTFSTANWNINGNAVTLTGSITDNVTGTSTWGPNTTLSSTPTIAQGAPGENLNFTGVLSGSGGITKTLGSGGQGGVYLSNTTNSFTGAVTISSGTLYFCSLAPAGQASSLGAGTGAIAVGSTGTGFAGSLIYLGSANGVTARNLSFANNQVVSPTLDNNSPNNSSLTFNGTNTFADGTVGDVFTLALGGTSTGTNTFNGPLGGPAYWGGSVQVSGPGTWLFTNISYVTGSLTVGTNSHVALSYNANYPSSTILYTNININPGGTMDVSAYDRNGSTFVLGNYESFGYSQNLIAGRPGINTPATDINGSLNLGNGVAGAAQVSVGSPTVVSTLTISSNLTVSSGTLIYKLGSVTTAGSGVNDLIQVGGNLDCSGNATIVIQPVGEIQPNVPYTLITYGGTVNGNASGWSLAAVGRTFSGGTFSTATPGKLTVTFTGNGVVPPNPLLWEGYVNGNWDVQTTYNWSNNVSDSSDVFYQYDTVLFSDISSQTNVTLVGSLQPTSITVSNNADSYSMSGSGSIAGGSLLKQGIGTLALTTANSFAGGTIISAGTIIASNATAIGSGTVTLGDTNTGPNACTLLAAAPTSSAMTFANPILISSNGTGKATFANGGVAGQVTVTGPITMQRGLTLSNAASTVFLYLEGGATGTGDLTVDGGGDGGEIALQESTVPSATSSQYNMSGNLILTNGAYLNAQGGGVITNTANLILATNTLFEIALNPTPYNEEFCNALAGGGRIGAGRNVTWNLTLDIGGANGSGVFSGSFTNYLTYEVDLIKDGTGTEIFTGDNSASSGSTTVNHGVLEVDNATGSGLGSGAITVNAGGTLAGSGSINSSSNTVAINGTLAVGNSGRIAGSSITLTNTDGLTVNSGGIVTMNLFSGAGVGDNTGNPGAADVLQAQCPVTLASGTVMTVGNPNGMTAWAAGDKWKIANWNSTPTGTFTTLNLPALGSGLTWDTTQLYANGTIAVAVSSGPTQRAQILGVSAVGGNIVITGTNLNGGQNFQYAVLTSTNLTLSLTNWTVLSTNSFNANGTFNYTNVISLTNPATFFDVKAVQ